MSQINYLFVSQRKAIMKITFFIHLSWDN